MLSWAGSKPWALIGRVPRGVVLLGAGALLSAGVIVSAGFCFAGRVVEPCTSVVFVSVVVGLGSWPACWPFWTSWATAMAANTSTAISESGIAYISRFKMCAPLRHTRFSDSLQRFLLFSFAYRIAPPGTCP